METPADIILYETEDGRETVRLRIVNETVWLSQRQMAELFNVSQDNISLHLKNIYGDGELREEATTEESSVVQIEGNREVRRPLKLYKLDADMQSPNGAPHASPRQRPGSMNPHRIQP